MAALSIALLFVQNIADLWLPRYMSDMVDVGIMRGGVTDDVPRVMSAGAFELVAAFLDDAAAPAFAAAYAQDAPAGGISKEFPDITQGARFLAESGKDALKALGSSYSLAAARLSMRLGAAVGATADISAMEPGALYSMGLAPDHLSVPTVPEQTQEEIGASLTRLFYRELGADMDAMQQGSILRSGLLMLLITLLGMAVTVSNGFLSARVSTGIGRNLRRDVFAKVQTFSPAEFDRFSTSTLITRCTNDVQQVQMVAMMALRMVFSAPIMGVGGIVMAINTSVSMSWIPAVAVVALLVLQFAVFSRVIPKFNIMQKLTDRLNLVTRESLSGMMVIRAFGNEEREYERFETANRDITDTNLFVLRMFTINQPLMQFIMGCTTLTVILFGARAIAASNLHVGQMMAFMQYVMQIVQAFLMVGMMFMMLPRALVSAGRISEILDSGTAINDKPAWEIKTLDGRARGDIAFDNVSFKYRDAEAAVLENISFVAKAGETTAFIGSTGSGKSTLINLIPRFHDVTEGAITLDGVDLRDLAVKELRDNLGYVPQKGVLFSGDIASNLSFGKEDGSDGDFREALRTAQAEDFVFGEKEGLETEIAQGGGNVSGGQRQRLSIARALVRNAPVYIFDDSFSALDLKTDAALRRALRSQTSGATVLIVAQRVSTIMNADQIIVLDAGRIVGKGTHSELLAGCEQYREIAESQLSKGGTQ
jgi:ATP-binding cassette subfamily B protein